MQYKIIVDKQSRTNPSAEKKEYIIDIEELRYKGNVYDSLVITKDEDYVMRRLELTEYHVLNVLQEPIKQPIKNLNIELFEGDNYIYLIDMTGNKFYAEYIVKNDFTDTYITKAEFNSSITQTAKQIELSVNEKLIGYSTTEEMNAAIKLESDNITSSVSRQFENVDKAITTTNSKITQTADSITSSVAEEYATKDELVSAKSEIKQTTDSIQLQVNNNNTEISILNQTASSISSEVSKKVGNDEIISKINQSAESVGIEANRINLTANDILNLISGNEINLKSKNIKIVSDNFNVDKDGNLSCNNATINNADITGGKLVLSNSTYAYPNFIISGFGMAGFEGKNTLYADGMRVKVNETTLINLSIGKQGEQPTGSLSVSDGSYTTYVNGSCVMTPEVKQISKESVKKNIVEYNEKASDIVKNSKIYTYNFKNEYDKHKKHIGFVIGDEGGEYKTPEQVISNDREGIENYTMTSILWKAVQEQQEEIDILRKEIEKLKEGNK